MFEQRAKQESLDLNHPYSAMNCGKGLQLIELRKLYRKFTGKYTDIKSLFTC